MGARFAAYAYAGLGVTQTKTIAGPAYIGSCALTHDLVCDLLKVEPTEYVPPGVEELLTQHATSADLPVCSFQDVCQRPKAQRSLSDEVHKAILSRLTARSSPRTKNLLLACTMGHASDWLLVPPIPGLGLSIPSANFRTALKFRLGLPLFDAGMLCPAQSSTKGTRCDKELDVYGDHALCCHFGTSRVFRHNNLRDILGHAARGAGLAAVVIEKKNQITGSQQKPGDITIQQYSHGFSSTAFDVTVTHPLQLNLIRRCE